MCLTCRPFVLFLVLVFSLTAHAQFSSSTIAKTSVKSHPVEQIGGVVTVTAPTLTRTPGSTFDVAISASNTTGLGITGYDMSLDFDSTILQYNGCTLVGTIFNSYPGTCNIFPAPNTIDVAVGGVANVSGVGPIVIFNFTAIGTLGQVSPLTFSFFQFNEGDPADVTTNGSITVGFAPSAGGATLSGRVVTQNGAGLRNAVVTMTDPQGVVHRSISSPMGYYRFEDLPVGTTYILSVASKRFQFMPRVVTLNDSLTEWDLTAVSGD